MSDKSYFLLHAYNWNPLSIAHTILPQWHYLLSFLLTCLCYSQVLLPHTPSDYWLISFMVFWSPGTDCAVSTLPVHGLHFLRSGSNLSPSCKSLKIFIYLNIYSTFHYFTLCGNITASFLFFLCYLSSLPWGILYTCFLFFLLNYK